MWSSGCSSWYLDAAGKNRTLWPGFTLKFREATSEFNPDDYELVARRRTARPAGSVDHHELEVCMRDFQGKVCVVTGAGSGIGRALALELGAPRGAAGDLRLERGCRGGDCPVMWCRELPP